MNNKIHGHVILPKTKRKTREEMFTKLSQDWSRYERFQLRMSVRLSRVNNLIGWLKIFLMGTVILSGIIYVVSAT